MVDLLGSGSKETELCLGLPGGGVEAAETPKATGKRGFSETVDLKLNLQAKDSSTMDFNENVKNINGAGNKEKTVLAGASAKDPAKPPAK